MAAHLKSRVLHREEKGFGAVSMKRMIFSFMGSGFVFFALRFTPLAGLTIPLTLISLGLFFYYSGDRYGVPRYQWIFVNWRGSLLLNARKNPRGLSAMLCKSAKWDVSKTVLNGADVFAAVEFGNDDWSGIEILESDDFDDGGFEILSDDDVIIVEAG
jgi:hypothetical protein